MSDIYVATRSAVIHTKDGRVQVRKGVTRVRAGHPLLEGREDMFKPIDVHFDVEQATAAPGETRTTRRRKKADEATEDDGED